MRRCDSCGRFIPPNNMATHQLVRVCDDCRIEPPVNLDVPADLAENARTPGVHLRILIEGVVDVDARRSEARRQLNQIGLTDPEITVMALICTGYSTRHIAQMHRWSQAFTHKLILSSTRKLRRSRLEVPKGPPPEKIGRMCVVDPDKLIGMADRMSNQHR